MATKNLARTVIEGGRYGWSQDDARLETRRERHRSKMLLHGTGDLDGSAFPRRGSFPVLQRDKLGPVTRWLLSNSGRPWRKVYAELVAKFDTRTIAGGHLVFNHMLSDIAAEGAADADRRRFVIDRHGILRRNKKYGLR